MTRCGHVKMRRHQCQDPRSSVNIHFVIYITSGALRCWKVRVYDPLWAWMPFELKALGIFWTKEVPSEKRGVGPGATGLTVGARDSPGVVGGKTEGA
jgi:hypothetical protein